MDFHSWRHTIMILSWASLCSYSLKLQAQWRNSKYKFCSLWFDLMGAQTHYLLNSKRTCKPFTQLMWCFHLPLCSQSSYEFDSRQHLWSSTLVTCGRFVVFSGYCGYKYILYVVFTKILYCNYTNKHIIINLWKKIIVTKGGNKLYVF